MNTKLLSVVVAVASTLFVALSASAEFTCELSFPQAPSTALANFPVLVRLAEDAPTGFHYADCPTASCIWFTDENDDAIPCDVDTWDTTSNSLVWVSVPSLSSSAKITMHWDAAGAPAGLPAASEVWTRAGYNAVWHFSGSAAESVNGLTASVTKGTPTCDGNANYPGPLGKTLWLANNSALAYANDPAWTTLGANASLTVSCWARPDGIGTYARMVCCQTEWKELHGYTFAVHNPISKITLGSSDSSEVPLNAGTGNWSGWPSTDWVHLTARYDNTTGAIFKDGQLATSDSINPLATPQGTLYLGANGDGTQRFWVGGLDEIRIRRVASSADWVAAEYATATDANYVSFGEVGTGVEVLRLGSVAVSDVTATNAVVTGLLGKLGEGATSADLWLIYTDGITTNTVSLGSTNIAPAALSYTLVNLAERTNYTCWFTATNNLSAGADSSTATFTTKKLPNPYAFSCELSFPSAPASPIENFPVLVRLAEDAPAGFSYADCPDADCIWFTDEDDEILPCDVDTWNTAGESLVWVSVPSLSSSTKIIMCWSDAGETLPASTEVWRLAGYVGVWHMNEILEDGAGKHYTPDSSASGWDAYKANEADAYPVTISDAGIADSAPPTGHAMVNQLNDNNRTTGGFLVPESATSGTTIGPFTISFFEASAANGNDRVVGFGAGHPQGCITAGTGNTYVMAPGGFNTFNYDDGLANNAWRHIAGIFNTNLAGYVGGDYRNLNKNVGNNYSVTLSNGIGLGTFTGHTETFRGNLDEIRIRNVASSDAWIAAEYAVVNNGSYVSFGEVSEPTAATRPLEFGNITVSSATATSAILTARLKGLGEGATSADVRVVVSGFGQTFAYPVTNGVEGATSIVATLDGLNPGTEWTAWFVATNNAAPAVGTNSAAVVFSTVSDAGFVGTPGLYQAASSGQSNASDAAHGWNIVADGVVTPGPQAMRNGGSDSWTSADGTTFQWASGAAFAYTGYMYMESGKDYYFSAAIDDAGYAWVNDGSGDWYAVRQSPQFNTTWKADGPYNVSESGYHQVVFSAWNNSGGAGATGNNMLRYVAVAPGASAPAQASADWLATVDPGDGSLFLPTPPVRAVSVVSARRDGTVVSAKVALEAAVAGETSELLYVYGATHGGNNPTNWTGRGLVDSSPAMSAVTNDYLVGIASDTRYIRFYTKSGDSVNWSATIAVEWAEETTLAETFVFTGEISASDVATTNATILGHLAALGDGATSADVWLVLSGLGQTKTYAVTHLTEGAELSAALSNLIPGTEWTVHFTATNNLGAGADSPAFTFSTLSDAGAAGVSGFYQVRIMSQNTLRSAATLDIVGDADGTLVAPAPHGLRAAVGVPWYSTDGTQWTYGGNTGYGYSGYMFMEGGKDYYFSAGIDDEGHVWVDNGAANWDAAHTASQFPSGWAAAGPFAIAEDGWYHVVFAGWNGGGNGGANGTYGPLRYIAVESGASAPVKESTTWIDAVDPGDGSLFLSDKPSRKVAVLSADRDGDLLSAKVALGAAFAGETSVLRYVYGASNGGNDLADWEGGSLVSAALPPGAVTNDYLVGIAANTRFVRFYATDGISLTWSDTIALEWSGETEVPDTFLFLGEPDAALASADTATLSAVLNAPGEDATSAQAWFVVTGGGETRVIPAGTATGRTNLAVEVASLTPETTYTFYATATNNAATPVGVNSSVGTFVTGPAASGWNTAKATFAFDGKILTATIPVTHLGFGTTTVSLMTALGWNMAGAENTVSDSAIVTEPGVVTLTADFTDQPWGARAWYSLKLVNGTAENAITNWPNVNVAGSNVFYNKSADLQDNSTYTWIGGETGVWNDTNNWIRTATGSYAATRYADYPVYGSTAVFATNVQVTVTIPATEGTTTVVNGIPSWSVSNVNLTNMDAPLVFTPGPQGQTSTFYIAGSIVASRTSNRITFDGCLCQLPKLKDCGASAYDAENGGNLVVTITGGSEASFSSIEPNYPGVKIRIEDGSLVKSGNISAGSGNTSYPTVIEIEDAELRSTGRIEPDTNGKGGTIFRFLGRSPKLLSSYYQAKNADTPSAFEFVVPAGGYFTPPLHFYGDSILASGGSKAIQLRVSADSPALATGVGTTTRFVDAKIAAGSSTARVDFDLPTGVTTSTYTDANGNADGYVVTIPAGDGPSLSDVALAYAGNGSFDVTGSVDPGSAGSATVKVYVAEGEGDFAAAATENVNAAGAFRLQVSGLTDGTVYRWYAEAVSTSGSHATEPESVTFQSGIASVSAATVEPHPVLNGDTVYTFTDSTAPGSITFSQGGLVEVLVVGGGGAGGNSAGGGGGGGAFLHRRAFVPAGTYAVTVGKGGYNATVANNVLPVDAESSALGALFVAAGGGAGGCWDIPSGTSLGGSAGGNSDKVGTPTTSGTYPFGHDGGVVPVGGNKNFAGGGGGAGGVGGDGRIWNNVYIAGYGGDGVACDITGESVIYAAGGGGGAGTTGFISGAAGLGGVPGCGPAEQVRVQDAPANTGAGGGGGNFGSNYLKQGGAGGSGIVVVRVLTGADDGSDGLDVKTLTADVTGNSATISGSLIKLGAGATSANVWLVVTGGGETRSIDLGTTNAVPAAFTYKVEGLAYGTDYTFYLTATNNLGVGAGEASGAASAATPGNELYYSEISFPSAPASPLENFPVLLRISSASPVGFSYANCPTADKLWVLDDTGAILPFEVDTWNPDGESLIWVSVPNFSADTTLTLQWAVDGHSRPSVPEATEVWSRAGYVAVWHMNELLDDNGSTYTPDATTNGWHAYKANEADAFPLADTVSSYAASAPPTGRAMANQLGDDTFTTGGFLVPAALTSGTTIGPFSISLFEAYTQAQNNKYSSTVSFAPAFNTLASMRIKLDTCWIYNGGSNPSFSLTADGQAYSAWRHLGGVWDAVPYGYLNGEARYLNQKNWDVSKTLSNGIGLGMLTGQTETLQGYMDEVRIRNAASSADWMAAEYATVMDHGYAVFEDAEIDTGAPRVGKPAIVEAFGTSATLAATVVKLGDNATEADIWLVLEGGTETLTYPVGTATAPLQTFTNTVTGLANSTVYTAYFTVTNNAAPAAGADSKTVSFETETLPANWNTGSFALSGSGKSLTASINVTDLGTGTTTLYLMTGPGWNTENTVSATSNLTATGVHSFTLDCADVPWGTSVYVSFLLVNGTEANAITNGPYTGNGQAFYNKYVTFQDNSTYTWIGGAAGDWNDPTKWELTTKGSVAGETPAGYPVCGSTANFTTNIEVTVTVPATAGTSVMNSTACWAVNSLNLNGMSAPITFVSASAADECRIHANGISLGNALLDVTFDGCYFYTSSNPTIGANDTVDGRNAVMTFTNGARAHFNQIYITQPAAKLRVLDEAYVEDTYLACGVNVAGEENRPVLEVRDAEYMNRSGKLEFDWNNRIYGLLIRLLGTHPRVSSANIALNRASGGCIEFVVPAGGYADAPIHLLSNSAFNSAEAEPIALRVSSDSPALQAGFATTTRLVDAKLVDVSEESAAVSFELPSGVTVSRHTNEYGNEEGYDCAIPAGNGPTLSNVGITGCEDASITVGGTVDKAATVKVYLAVVGGEFVQAGSAGVVNGQFTVRARKLTAGVSYRWFVEATTVSGSHRTEPQEFTFCPGKAAVAEASEEPILVEGEKVYVFTNSTEAGSITFARGGLVEVLVIGGGGAGGNAMGGGGGAGAFLYRRDFIPAGTYEVTVGKGGYNNDKNQSIYAIPAESSSIGDIFVAPGGGAGGHWGSQGLTQGGSAGGNSGGAGIPAIGSYPLGRDGGSQTTGGQWIGSGGGGAGSAGHDSRTWGDIYYGGRGGDGVACAITGEKKIYAAGGGGGAGVAGFIPGSAGLGGVRGCGMSDTERFDAPNNTGSGGGGGNYQDNEYRKGGSGGSGIVVIRVKKFDKIGFSIIVR